MAPPNLQMCARCVDQCIDVVESHVRAGGPVPADLQGQDRTSPVRRTTARRRRHRWPTIRRVGRASDRSAELTARASDQARQRKDPTLSRIRNFSTCGETERSFGLAACQEQTKGVRPKPHPLCLTSPPLREVQALAVSEPPVITMALSPLGPLRLAVVPWLLVLTFKVGWQPREV